MTDQETEFLSDIQSEGFSNCCGAKVYLDTCADCKEPCGIVFEEEDDKLCGACGKLMSAVYENNGFTPPDPTHYEVVAVKCKNKACSMYNIEL